MREKETLQRRVKELEVSEGSALEEKSRLRQELDTVSAQLQQAQFDIETLSSQLQLAKSQATGTYIVFIMKKYHLFIIDIRCV